MFHPFLSLFIAIVSLWLLKCLPGCAHMAYASQGRESHNEWQDDLRTGCIAKLIRFIHVLISLIAKEAAPFRKYPPLMDKHYYAQVLAQCLKGGYYKKCPNFSSALEHKSTYFVYTNLTTFGIIFCDIVFSSKCRINAVLRSLAAAWTHMGKYWFGKVICEGPPICWPSTLVMHSFVHLLHLSYGNMGEKNSCSIMEMTCIHSLGLRNGFDTDIGDWYFQSDCSGLLWLIWEI